MQELDDDGSSSDEEYVPPSKTRKLGARNDLTSQTESEYSDDDEDTESVESEDDALSNSIENTNGDSKDVDSHINSNKEKEDRIWNEFLNSAEPLRKPVTEEASTVVKRYQFAGEEIEVEETIRNQSNNSSKLPTSMSTGPVKANGKSDLISIPRLGGIKSNLSSALTNLKSLASGKAPKLSTLEKSRLDWEKFVKNEDIEHDLKSHNKGKDAYLERQAFVNRAAEREYEYKRSLESSSNRKKL